MIDDPRDRLAVMWHQLRCRHSWPAPPSMPLTPVDAAALVPITDAELAALVWPPDAAQVAGGEPPDALDQRTVVARW
jgi:hypothetical protein